MKKITYLIFLISVFSLTGCTSNFDVSIKDEMIIQNVKPKGSIRNRIHEYKINATRAFHTIRKFFKTKGDLSSPNLESIISKNIEPIRLNRSDPRKVRAQTAVFFIYRF